MSGWSGDHCRMASDLIDKEESTCRSGDRCQNQILTQLTKKDIVNNYRQLKTISLRDVLLRDAFSHIKGVPNFRRLR